jgi:hypothetical protein
VSPYRKNARPEPYDEEAAYQRFKAVAEPILAAFILTPLVLMLGLDVPSPEASAWVHEVYAYAHGHPCHAANVHAKTTKTTRGDRLVKAAWRYETTPRTSRRTCPAIRTIR